MTEPAPSHQVMVRLRERGLARMGATGEWELTREGEDHLAELRALYYLGRRTNRPGGAPGSQPRRQAPRMRPTGAAAPRGRGTTGG